MSLEETKKRWNSIINFTPEVVYYPTSFITLNRALGGYGFKGGKLVQILAEFKSGKTTLSADVIANAQKAGKTCALLDYERSYDESYYKIVGVDTKSLIRLTPRYIDQGAQVTEELADSGEVGVIVVDSVPMAQHPSEKENSMEDNQRVMGTSGDWTRHIKRLVPIASDTNTLVIFINQYRANTNPRSPKLKDPWGANAIQYHTDYHIELTRIKNEAGKATVQAVVTRNKCAATEGYKTELILEHGKGFRADLDILTAGIDAGIIQQKGAWLSYQTHKAAGKENAAQTFPLDDIRAELETYYKKGN